MATQDMMGMFGPTPEEIRRQRMQQEMQTPMLSADPRTFMAQVGTGMGTQLAGLARDVGGMFGLRTTAEAEAQGVQEAIREVDAMGYTDLTKKMTALADALQKRGLSRQAMQALEQGRKMEVEDLQRKQAQAGLMEFKPIYGEATVETDPLTGKTQTIRPVIGYQRGTEYYSKEAAEAIIRGGAPAPRTTPPPQTRDPAAVLRENVARAAAKEQKQQVEAGAAAAQQPGSPTEQLLTPPSLNVPSDLNKYQEPGPFVIGQQKEIVGKELKAGVDYKVVTPKSNDPSEIRRATRQTKVNELRARYKKAKTKTERTFIVNEARQLGLIYGKDNIDPTLKVR